MDGFPISNAACLAEGSLLYVVVLEESCASADCHDYNTMVWGDEDAEIKTPRHDGSALERRRMVRACRKWNIHPSFPAAVLLREAVIHRCVLYSCIIH